MKSFSIYKENCLVLVLLMLASQRIETFIGGWWFWSDSNSMVHEEEELPTKRGAKPTFIEWLILSWVSGKFLIVFFLYNFGCP